MLELLVERSGNIVSKDEMLGTVWNGSFVEESNLPVHISKVRKLLGESNSERFIETVHGTGYRFVAPVRLATKEEWKQRSSSSIDGLVDTHRLVRLSRIYNTNRDLDQATQIILDTAQTLRQLLPAPRERARA